jgi:4'-phosphopantetheinyl transferase
MPDLRALADGGTAACAVIVNGCPLVVTAFTLPPTANALTGRSVADRALLSPDERARADRLRVPEKQAAFVAARAGLRRTLAAALGEPDAAALGFGYGPHGKAYLLAPHDRLAFSFTHTGWHAGGEVALVAIAHEPAVQVGIDAEQIRLLEHADAAAALVFAPEECARWAAAPAEHRWDAFYRLWVRKEAAVKAQGGRLADGRTWVLADSDARVCPLVMPAGYAAAVCVWS